MRPGQNRGQKNFKCKLTPEDVLQIIMWSDSHSMTQQAIAAKFDVSQSAINHILSGLTWTWLTGRSKKEKKAIASSPQG